MSPTAPMMGRNFWSRVGQCPSTVRAMCSVVFWGVAKGSSIAWVAKLQGDKQTKKQNESCQKWAVAKLQCDKTAYFCNRKVAG